MLHAHTVTSSADLMPARVAPAPAFTVTPRPCGGYRLSCTSSDGVEVMGAVFCTGDDLQDEADAYVLGGEWLAGHPDAPPLILLHREDGAVIPCDSLAEAVWLADVLWSQGYVVSLFDCGSIVVSEVPRG